MTRGAIPALHTLPLRHHSGSPVRTVVFVRECPLLLCQGLIAICGFRLDAGHERGGADRDDLDGLERVGGCCWLVGEEQSPDAACEIALEAAKRFAAGLPVCALTFQVGAGLGVDAGTDDRDDVQGLVELPIAAAVQPMSLGVAGTRRLSDRSGSLR
jgi:hypothetical protein